MSALLDKSLDEILSSSKKVNRRKTNRVGKKPVAKAALAKKTPTGPAKKPVVFPKSKPVVDTSYATKVIVHNLPKDIKQDAIKVCECR